MDGKQFDEISKMLATNGISPRRVVRGLCGGLLATALAGLGLSRASAANGGNSANAQWCHAHTSGAAADQCGPASDDTLKLCGDTCAECCDAGDCTGGGACVSGTCQTSGPITCHSSDTRESPCSGSTNPNCECGTDLGNGLPICYLDTRGRVDLNGGCGGRDNYTGGAKGICQLICTG